VEEVGIKTTISTKSVAALRSEK